MLLSRTLAPIVYPIVCTQGSVHVPLWRILAGVKMWLRDVYAKKPWRKPYLAVAKGIYS